MVTKKAKLSLIITGVIVGLLLLGCIGTVFLVTVLNNSNGTNIVDKHAKDKKEIKQVVQKFWISFPQKNLEMQINSLNSRGRKFLEQEMGELSQSNSFGNKIEENSFFDAWLTGFVDAEKKILDDAGIKYSEDNYNYPEIKPHSIKSLTAKADISIKGYKVAVVGLDKENEQWKVNMNDAIESARKIYTD